MERRAFYKKLALPMSEAVFAFTHATAVLEEATRTGDALDSLVPIEPVYSLQREYERLGLSSCDRLFNLIAYYDVIPVRISSFRHSMNALSCAPRTRRSSSFPRAFLWKARSDLRVIIG